MAKKRKEIYQWATTLCSRTSNIQTMPNVKALIVETGSRPIGRRAVLYKTDIRDGDAIRDVSPEASQLQLSKDLVKYDKDVAKIMRQILGKEWERRRWIVDSMYLVEWLSDYNGQFPDWYIKLSSAEKEAVLDLHQIKFSIDRGRDALASGNLYFAVNLAIDMGYALAQFNAHKYEVAAMNGLAHRKAVRKANIRRTWVDEKNVAMKTHCDALINGVRKKHPDKVWTLKAAAKAAAKTAFYPSPPFGPNKRLAAQTIYDWARGKYDGKLSIGISEK